MKLMTLILVFFISQKPSLAEEVGVIISDISCEYIYNDSIPEISIEVSPGYKFKGREYTRFYNRPQSSLCLDLSEFRSAFVSQASFDVQRRKNVRFDEYEKCYEMEDIYLNILIHSTHSTRTIKGMTLLETIKIRALQYDYCVDNPY